VSLRVLSLVHLQMLTSLTGCGELLMSSQSGRAHSSETLFVVDVLNMIEALGNLNHLIKADSGDAEAVHSYVTQADDILGRLAALIRSRTLSDRMTS
jgi:hypothetical protein